MDAKYPKIFLAIVTYFWFGGCGASKSAERLYDKLMRNYSAVYRPVEIDTDKVMVHLGLDLSQLVDIDEQNEMMVTSVWLDQQWRDYKLVWDPADYEGLESMKLQIDQIWYPDILLYNTAEGSYNVEVVNWADVYYDGVVKWRPPANFKSSCNIDIQHFPFDVQTCYMKFGAWTHGGSVMDLQPINDYVGRKRGYRKNGEWEIKDTAAIRYEETYACCEEPFIDIRFYFVLKRNSLFYVITLVVPCILIAFLTLSVFYIPSDAQEKITLSISVLLALILFLLLIPSIVPSTSKTIPLIVKYMLFTMSIVSISIVSTVITINLNFRSSLNHKMPKWVRRVFLELLPKLLRMERPAVVEERKRRHMAKKLQKEEQSTLYSFLATMDEGTTMGIRSNYDKERFETSSGAHSPQREELAGCSTGFGHSVGFRGHDVGGGSTLKAHLMWTELVGAEDDIVRVLKESDVGSEIEEEWTYVSLVIDRILLYLFTVAVVVGTIYAFIQSSSTWQNTAVNNGTGDTNMFQQSNLSALSAYNGTEMARSV